MSLPTITKKQKEILLLLYRFRFLNRIQIQKLLNHKSPKNTNVWLKDLTDKKYTSRIFEKKAGINDPAIYYISKNGVRFLKTIESCQKEYIQKLYQDARRSEIFIKQNIDIASIYLDLKSQKFTGFKFYTPTDFPINGVIREISPSFAYIKDGQYYACDIIRENYPRFAIRSIIRKFLEFFNSQKDMIVIFYCRSEKLLKYIEKYTTTLKDEDDLNIEVLFKPLT